MRSIGLSRSLLAISRIDVSPFPPLPPSLLPPYQGCGWLLPALTLMTDMLYRHRPPLPRHTTRGTVARSEESVPALRATRMSARVFPRFQGAARTACRGPGTPPLTGLGMNAKPRAMPRRFQTAGLSFSGHSLNLLVANRNFSGDTIGFEGSRTEKTYAARYHLESHSASEWLTLSDLFRAVKRLFCIAQCEY
ncbi:hypothetical protein AMELA_G00062190 [Ameiurus melas]|uniref:Uncharacterized protein n=1 Tax=Ameiurus melas TaxID=219545 RepID=A0A7J6B1T4_AMEME|nr:hypothetical protein AMELA_G00062190 [Ameiurus melas]